MIKRFAVFTAVAICAALVVMFAPAFAREIAVGVSSLGQAKSASAVAALPTAAHTSACPQEPWPYGCAWRPKVESRHLTKKALARRHHKPLATASRGFSVGARL